MEHILGNESPETEHLEDIVEIIRDFSDGIHHAKEEQLFFPFLATKGFSLTQGPVGVMMNEHVAGRNFVKGMSDNISLYKNGKKEALDKIYYNMNGYAELLKAHIAKENNILFRMADRTITPDEHAELLREFSKAESDHASRDLYIERINRMAAFYGIEVS
jgi:hemerythrin-like domain-containing protein